MNKKYTVVFWCSILLSAASSLPAAQLRIVVWNVQTFFDGEDDGTEYDSFRSSRGWNQERYGVRVRRLCDSLRKINADIVILVELEKEAQLAALTSGEYSRPSSFRPYRFACFAAAGGGATGCAVLSRVPLSEFSVHQLDIRTEHQIQPSLRPLLQVTVVHGGKQLILFAAHWKSSLGGGEAAEVWRSWQERILADAAARSMQRGAGAVIVCGDLNRDISHFTHAGQAATPAVLFRGKSAVTARSLWYDGNGSLVGPGSYVYRGRWERIDHFFLIGDVRLVAFNVRTDGPWAAKGTGVPRAYRTSGGAGYSDHLPLAATVAF
jgi:endonuclease/exonuclease/phosphatase family metal-dependent hydrolase